MTDSKDSLEDILEGDASSSEQVEQPGESEAATKDGESDKAKGESSAPPAEKEESWTRAAVLDERRKRQALEEELAKLKNGEKPEPKAKRPDVFEDQEAAFQHTEQSLETRIVKERISLSREMLMSLKDDYEEKETVFLDLAKKNPALVHEMRNSPNPAKFAYQTASNYLEAQALSDPERVEKIKEKMRQEILDELKAGETPGVKRKKSAVSVPDLVNATSAASGHATPGNESLADIFGR